MKRLVTLVISLFMAVGTLLVVMPTPAAHAATHCWAGTRDAHHRKVNVCGYEPRTNHFTIKGRIFQNYGHKVALLQRAACLHCRWHVVRRDRTTARGKFAFRNVTKLGFYRVKARAGHGYRASYSTIMRIYTV